MKASNCLISSLLAVVVCVQGVAAQSVPAPSVLPATEAWVEIQKDSVLLDVRTPEEFEKGNLKGSILIPYDEIEARVSELGSDKAKTIVVYCASGRRAGKAAASLRSLGFTSVVNAGGYDELVEATPKACSNPLRC